MLPSRVRRRGIDARVYGEQRVAVCAARQSGKFETEAFSCYGSVAYGREIVTETGSLRNYRGRMDGTQIKEHMPVVCSENGQFGTVDKVEGDSIKLTQDKQGEHHWIPTSWVTKVDDRVHVDRPGREAMQQGTTSAPVG